MEQPKNLIKQGETAKSVYARLENDREPYITRAEDSAKYTIPALFPKENDTGSTNYDTPYQSVGARGVNNLASKLMLALFPPNAPFFRFDVREDVLKYLEGTPQAKQEIEQKLVQQEQVVLKYIEGNQVRVTLHEAVKQLIVAGNCLLFLPPKEGGIKMYRLNSYTIQRDAMGNVIQIVTKDKLTYATLPPEIQKIVEETQEPDKEVDVYTHVYYSSLDERYYSYQEIDEVVLPGYEQSFPKDACPWIPVRLTKMDGESYGRSYCEEYLGDLKTLENLSKAIVEYAAISASIFFLVNPNGVTQVRKLANCANGGFIPGRPEDIATLQIEKHQDFQVAKATVDDLEARLSYVFMLNSAVQRNGERVTAEEIRYVARELEDTLGGIYSILSQELQLPLVKRIIAQLQATGQLASLPDNIVTPAITTGVEALGRGHDLNKITTFLSVIQQNPDAASAINWDGLTKALASSCDLDLTGLIKTPEQIAQEQQQVMMSQMATAATPNIAKGFMDNLNNQTQGGTNGT